MRTDFKNLQDGDRVTLFPNDANPLHKRPMAATYSGGYFYCDGTSPADGPDYYFGDVQAYNDGFEYLPANTQVQPRRYDATAQRYTGPASAWMNC